MVTRTVIETTCDWCPAKGETYTIGGAQFDACGKHYKSELASVETLFARYGTPNSALAAALASKASKASKAGKAKRSKAVAKDEAPSGGPSLRAQAAQQQQATQQQATSARVTCGLCTADVARGSKAYHAKQYHSLRGSQIEWTDV